MAKMSKEEAQALSDGIQILHSALEHVAKKHGADTAYKALILEVQVLSARAKAKAEKAKESL